MDARLSFFKSLSRVAPLIVKADLKHPTKVIQGAKVILMFFENMGMNGIDRYC